MENLSKSFYNSGKLFLQRQGMPYDSLNAYAKAVHFSMSKEMIDDSLLTIENWGIGQGELSTYALVYRFLILGLAGKIPSPENIKLVQKISSAAFTQIQEPVVILAGGTDARIEKHIQSYRKHLIVAFRDFKGTIISGGTKTGVSGIIGTVSRQYPFSIQTIGYIPTLKDSSIVDNKYTEIRRTNGKDFSPLEPLQYWADIIACGISPSRVKLLGINGGTIAAVEYRMALSLGASVAVLEGSGGAVEQLLADKDWAISESLVCLPDDTMTVAAFLDYSAENLTPKLREAIAQAIHENYRRARFNYLNGEDPALAEWDRLPPDLRESNLHQADDIVRKLGLIGRSIEKVTGRKVKQPKFTADEIELMAEAEHGRWNVERLLAGWKRGEKRDNEKKTSPYLVGWAELPEDIKEWDREPVRHIPELLAGVDLEIRRKYRGGIILAQTRNAGVDCTQDID